MYGISKCSYVLHDLNEHYTIHHVKIIIVMLSKMYMKNILILRIKSKNIVQIIKHLFIKLIINFSTLYFWIIYKQPNVVNVVMSVKVSYMDIYENDKF